MMDDIKQSVEKAKNSRIEALQRYHIGDIVYPVWQNWAPPIWGTVVEISVDTRRITVNINGTNRQFDPEDIILTNPELRTNQPNQREVAIAEKVVQKGFQAATNKRVSMYWKESPGVFKVSQNEIENNAINCPYCKGSMKTEYSGEEKVSKYACSNCGKKILVKNVRTAAKAIDPNLYKIRAANTAYAWLIKRVSPVLKGVKRDTAWEEIRRLEKEIQSTGINYEYGKVDSSNYNIEGGSKTWNATLSFINIVGQKIVLQIQIIAAAAGTVDNPWGAYDITMPLVKGEMKTAARRTAGVNAYLVEVSTGNDYYTYGVVDATSWQEAIKEAKKYWGNKVGNRAEKTNFKNVEDWKKNKPGSNYLMPGKKAAPGIVSEELSDDNKEAGFFPPPKNCKINIVYRGGEEVGVLYELVNKNDPEMRVWRLKVPHHNWMYGDIVHRLGKPNSMAPDEWNVESFGKLNFREPNEKAALNQILKHICKFNRRAPIEKIEIVVK